MRVCRLDGCDATITDLRRKYCCAEHSRAGFMASQVKYKTSLRGRVMASASRASRVYGLPRLDRAARISIAVRLMNMFIGTVSGRVSDMAILQEHFERKAKGLPGDRGIKPMPYARHGEVISLLTEAGHRGVDPNVFNASGRFPRKLSQYVDDLRNAGINIRLVRLYVLDENARPS